MKRIHISKEKAKELREQERKAQMNFAFLPFEDMIDDAMGRPRFSEKDEESEWKGDLIHSTYDRLANGSRAVPKDKAIDPETEKAIQKAFDIPKKEDVMKNQRGFTLMELVIVMAIVAFLAVAFIPNLATFLQKTKFRSATRDLVTTLRVAESNAIFKTIVDPNDPRVALALVYRVTLNSNKTYALEYATLNSVRNGNPSWVMDGERKSLPSGIGMVASVAAIEFFPDMTTTPTLSKTIDLQSKYSVSKIKVNSVGRIEIIKQ